MNGNTINTSTRNQFAVARDAEKNQTIHGSNLPCVVHLSNVAMKFL
ncbi:MAG TPA: hypothetical protein PLQ69_10155 [Paludibacter sp.]|jgi:hypothetical protein|nr:hypothetical protein [Paludibacter sp.]HPM11457.1 hypothetical protein [Paludibacter sp.]